jgi:glutaredoxin
MENIQSGSFLDIWHNVMLIGSILMFMAGIVVYILHEITIAAIKTPKGKYDYISRREIKKLELVFILFAVGVAMLINRYGMDKLDEMGVWFYVRLFMSFAGGTLVGYVAFLILEYYYPTRLDKKLRKWRYMPRVNPKTGNKMRLLAEHEEDVHLDEGMIAEENVFSMDYDVWFDEKSNDVLVEKYPGHMQALQCGSCGFFTLKVVREEITQKPTFNTPGELIKHYECSYCKSVRATAFRISTMEGDDFKNEKHSFRKEKDIVLIKVEIKSQEGGSKFFEFGDLGQAQKFLSEIEEGQKQ